VAWGISGGVWDIVYLTEAGFRAYNNIFRYILFLFDGTEVVLMADKRYDARLREFIAEIEQLNLQALAATQRWCLLKDIENGVDIGYDVISPSDRKILHHIGQRYGLIALCPGDVVELETSNGSTSFVVTTPFGKLPIRRRRMS
jgi:hypothetical protein